MSGSYLDDTAGGEGGWRPVWEDEPDETDRPPLRATSRPRAPAIDPADWLAPEALPALLAPLCETQAELARLDARAAAAPEAVRAGLNARVALAEAAGWLAFAHAWVDPSDLALKDLGLIGSYAIATRVGRPLRDMPNTFARRATRAWEDEDIDGLLAGDAAVATALTLARLTQRLARTGENPFGDLASASATLEQFTPEPLDGARFAVWRSELQAKIATPREDTPSGAGEGVFPALPPLLLAARAAERSMESGIVAIPTALQALLAAAGILVETATVRGVIPPIWSGYPAIGRPGHPDGLPALRAGLSAQLSAAPAWPIAFLHLLAEGARAAMRELDRLLAVAERGRGVTTGRDRRSLLPAALDAVLRAPVLTPKALAAELAIAPQTATSLMRELRAAGLVAEITGRRSFRAFAVVAA